MKTRLLILFFVSIFMSSMIMTNAFGWCPQNEDWSDAPCYAPYQATSESFQDKIKEDWAEYYDYKGEYWMEQKRYEMEQSIQNNSLGKWVDLDESHRNVHEYYYLQGNAPDLNGKYVFTCNLYEDIHRYEEILVHDVVLKKFFEKFPYSISSSDGIDESKPPQSHVFYEYDKLDVYASLLMRVFEGENISPCIVPRLYTLTYNDGSIDMEIRNVDVDTNEIFEFLDSLYSHLSPLKQFKSGILIDEIQCKEHLDLIQKYDGSPACVASESKIKLTERAWIQEVVCHGCGGIKTFDSYKINCDNQTNPYQEYECFKDAYSNCNIATVNPEIYTIEGDPIYTTLAITPDCKIQGVADMSPDQFWGTSEIIITKCDKISRDEYTWSAINCDAHDLSEMQFNFEMQLYPQILECEENGDTWVREKLECVRDKENEN